MKLKKVSIISIYEKISNDDHWKIIDSSAEKGISLRKGNSKIYSNL